MSICAHRPHHRLGSLVLGSALIAAAMAACGPQQPAASPEGAAAEAPPAEASTSPDAPAAPGDGARDAEVHFDQMSHEEKLTFMGTVVMPRMKPLFAAHEEHDHAEGEKQTAGKGEHEEHGFGCASCHGETMRDVGYKMPNTLVALPAENTVQAAMEMNEESTKFMLEQVVPTMAELLGEKAAEGGVGEGFGCFNCHQKE